MSIKNTTATDVACSVKALQVGVDALGMIAGFGGVQGDWAMDALREIKRVIGAGDEPAPTPQRRLTLVPRPDRIGVSA